MFESLTSLEPSVFPLDSDFVKDPPTEDPEIRSLARGEVLCVEGDKKTAVWRVESGLLCVTSPQEDGPPEIVELAFPGTVLGLGFLDHHTLNITAVVSSHVSAWPQSVCSDLAALAPDGPERQQHATEQEFAYQRRKLVAANASSPLCRVAAFLVAVSNIGRAEGRDPNHVSDKLRSGAVATLLGIDVTMLASMLAELQDRALVVPDEDGGLWLKNLPALERLASENI